MAVVGKGGAGKSVIAGTMARLLGRRRLPVLALDSDLMPGLALSLGAEQPSVPPLLEAAEKGEDGRWRLKPGIGPVRAVRRYSTPAPDGVRLLQSGKLSGEGLAPIMGAVNAFYKVIHRLREPDTFRSWAIVGDLPAGPRQAAFDWAPYADIFLVIAEPTVKSALTARRVARIARARRAPSVRIVASQVRSRGDAGRLEELLGEPLLGVVPADDQVAAAERLGVAPIDHSPDAPAIRAIDELVERVRDGSLR